MSPKRLAKLRTELVAFAEYLTADMGRAERRSAMALYIRGLLLDGERKSIVPMARRLAETPEQVESTRQKLQECITVSAWSPDEMFRRIGTKLHEELPGVEALVVDDTGFAKKGKHSVGVARQYSGTLGRVDNCQVAVSLHLAGEQGSGCIGMRLYLPKDWAGERERCDKAGVPSHVEFKEKWRIALEQVDDALEWGIRRPVLTDSGYGDVTAFRQGVRERGLDYSVGVSSTLVVWGPGTGPETPTNEVGARGRPRTRYRTGEQKPVKISVLASSLGRKAYRKVTWRDGTKGKMSSHFARVRVRTAHHHWRGVPPGPEEWLLCEWPQGESAPKKFYLCSFPASCSMKAMVRMTKLRWRIERDYQDLKGQLGLDHFEGRKWIGFHHHAALCAAAHAFLALQRALFPPILHPLDIRSGEA